MVYALPKIFKELVPLGTSRVYFDIHVYVMNNFQKYCAFYNHICL